MTERLQFIRDARQRLVTFTDLCALYGISRFTGYKWLHRAEQSGLDVLQELSRRPHRCPHATPAALTARVLEARRHHPTWGPRKLLALLRRQDQRHGQERPSARGGRLGRNAQGKSLSCLRSPQAAA